MKNIRKQTYTLEQYLSGSRENVTVTEIISIADMQDKRKAGYT